MLLGLRRLSHIHLLHPCCRIDGHQESSSRVDPIPALLKAARALISMTAAPLVTRACQVLAACQAAIGAARVQTAAMPPVLMDCAALQVAAVALPAKTAAADCFA